MISLTKEISGESGLELKRIKDIHFLGYDKKAMRVIFHTKNGMYYQAGTLAYWIDVLRGTGYNFRECDRNAAVNMDNITHIDNVFKRVCFDEKVGPDTKWCYMSLPKYNAIMDELTVMRPNLSFA